MTFNVYEVGGSIRDELLGKQNKDKDFSVECESFDAMRAELVSQGYEIFVETPQYLTIRAHFPKDHPEFGKTTADFVMCRKDGAYSDGRRPDTVEPGTILDDLARRDFTVNAMARKLGDTTILDPHDGQQDLKFGVLRAVGNAEDRIREDPLRALRAMRFAVVKDLRPSADVDHVLSSDWLPPLMVSVSIERRREELYKMFKHDTIYSITYMTCYPKLADAIFTGGLWLKPTNES